jgi:hypothetical protein
MMTDATNCERFSEQLMDYLEHDVDAGTRAAVEHHAGTCDECGTLLADLRKLRADAANLPELVPSRDLWSGIAARIETPVVPIGAGVSSGQQQTAPAAHRQVRRWLKSGAIAASLVAAAMIGYNARSVERERAQTSPVSPVPVRPSPDMPDTGAEVELARESERVAALSARETGVTRGAPSAPVIPAPSSVGTARATEMQLVVAKLTEDYDREISRLRVLIDQRRSQLDPTTVSVIERNLAVIDTAIAESRRAIASDPSSRFLIEFLNQSLRDKVELMRTAALLPSRT